MYILLLSTYHRFNSTLCSTGLKSRIIPADCSRGNNRFYSRVAYRTLCLSRLNCGHFVDLEKWDYMKQIFKYSAMPAGPAALFPSIQGRNSTLDNMRNKSLLEVIRFASLRFASLRSLGQ